MTTEGPVTKAEFQKAIAGLRREMATKTGVNGLYRYIGERIDEVLDELRGQGDDIGVAYYVNRNQQRGGDHGVHRAGCNQSPHEANRIELGAFTSCTEAVEEAKRRYPTANGCRFCSMDCHTE